MKKMNLMLPILIMLLVPDIHARAQNLDSLWSPFAYLAGEWTGEGKGTPGQGSGVSSFSFDLEKHLLVRKSHSSYPAMNGRPASVHDDLMMIYHEQGLGIRALYVDNESHVIHYEVRVSAAGDTLEFLSAQQAGAPRYRLRYITTGERAAEVSFDIAMPNAQDAFKRYISGGIVKK
jgi:hypothetical protein